VNSSTKDNHSYKEHAVYQQESLHNGLFVESLVGGLEKLDSLTNVALEIHWLLIYMDSGRGRNFTGSPLQSAWKPFRCEPSVWIFWEPQDPERDNMRSKPGSNGGGHYRIITKALFHAQTLSANLMLIGVFYQLACFENPF